MKNWEQKSAPQEVVEGQIYNEKSIGGNRGTNNRLEQFMKNDLRVLRFYCYWDDKTIYGVRQYYILSFFLAENAIQIADVHQRNSGRDPYPVFFNWILLALLVHFFGVLEESAICGGCGEALIAVFLIKKYQISFVIFDCKI